MPDFGKVCSQYKQDWTTVYNATKYLCSSPIQQRNLREPKVGDVAYAAARIAVVSVFAFATFKAALAKSIIMTAVWVVVGHDLDHLLINDENIGRKPVKTVKFVAHGLWNGLKSIVTRNHPLNGFAQERTANTIFGPVYNPIFEFADEVRAKRLHHGK